MSRFSRSGTPAGAPARACDCSCAEPGAGADRLELRGSPRTSVRRWLSATTFGLADWQGLREDRVHRGDQEVRKVVGRADRGGLSGTSPSGVSPIDPEHSDHSPMRIANTFLALVAVQLQELARLEMDRPRPVAPWPPQPQQYSTIRRPVQALLRNGRATRIGTSAPTARDLRPARLPPYADQNLSEEGLRRRLAAWSFDSTQVQRAANGRRVGNRFRKSPAGVGPCVKVSVGDTGAESENRL